MEATKFACFVAVILASFALDLSEARWVQLNGIQDPVCFKARGNQYGSFKCTKSGFVKSLRLDYRWGSTSCHVPGQLYSKWGCWPNNRDRIGAVITDRHNRILAPHGRVNNNGWYSLPGYTSSSSTLMFRNVNVRVYGFTELRLWYGEDLKDYTESDNGGETCADVWAEI